MSFFETMISIELDDLYVVHWNDDIHWAGWSSCHSWQWYFIFLSFGCRCCFLKSRDTEKLLCERSRYSDATFRRVEMKRRCFLKGRDFWSVCVLWCCFFNCAWHCYITVSVLLKQIQQHCRVIPRNHLFSWNHRDAGRRHGDIMTETDSMIQAQ